MGRSCSIPVRGEGAQLQLHMAPCFGTQMVQLGSSWSCHASAGAAAQQALRGCSSWKDRQQGQLQRHFCSLAASVIATPLACAPANLPVSHPPCSRGCQPGRADAAPAVLFSGAQGAGLHLLL